jgi:hypothetical protein
MNDLALNSFNAEFVVKAMATSLSNVPVDDLAYLFATGKNELYLRDLLATYLHNSLNLEGDEFVGREWRKHDLSINRGNIPLVVIEGKSYIHYDAANKVHLEGGKNTIKHDLEKDLAKCYLTNAKSKEEAKIFFTAILFTVGVNEVKDYRFKNLTYGQYHRQGINRFGSMSALRNEGNLNLQTLMSRYGITTSIQLPTGIYRGLSVVADFHVLQVR